MIEIVAPLIRTRHRHLPLLDRLSDLFAKMAQGYAAVADQYGFHCNGCDDNCCLTRFYHHTLLELLYLVQGLETLSAGERQTLAARAAAVEQDAGRGTGVRRMCPLNDDGRCRLYAHRPMICRLHGIPHELHAPGGGIGRHPGCDAFHVRCRDRGKTDYIPFDRTPFYREMAVLEKELRRETGIAEKIKLTVAQMLIMIMEFDHEID